MTLRLADGNTLELPIHPNDLKFSWVEDFKALRQKLLKVGEIEDVHRQAEMSHRLMLASLKAVQITGLDSLPMSFPEDNMAEFVEDRFVIDMGFLQGRTWIKERRLQPRLSTMRVYVHVCNMIDYWQPKSVGSTYRIKFRGVEYCINPDEAMDALNGKIWKTGEVLTVLELQKKMHRLIDTQGDKQGNLAFTLGMNEFSILMRRPGERLPSNKRERNQFIDRRTKLFSDLPYGPILKARFFLVSTLQKRVKTQLLDSFLKVPQSSTDGLVVKTQPVRLSVVRQFKRPSGK